MRNYTLKDLEEQNMIVFSAIMGSHAYGTATPESDTDIRGVFIQPLEEIMGFGYVEQVSDKSNDIVYYEIRRFLELVQTNNPNILEILNVPEDCIRYKDPIFDMVLDHKEKFLSKICKMSFSGYAIQQIKKAKGYNKKINWEESKMTRKTVLDFCYIIKDAQTIPFKNYLENLNKNYTITQENFGLAKIDHAHDIYAMYVAPENEKWGIVSNEETANDVQLWSIPKGKQVVEYLTFNKDAYSTHCKKYAEYKEWLENRNKNRFKMNKDHGKNYDSKNMMHCIRLLNMGIEIARDKQINVRRSKQDIDMLMRIRRGEMEFDEIIGMAETRQELLDIEYEKSDLPSKIDKQFVDDLLIKIRKERYK